MHCGKSLDPVLRRNTPESVTSRDKASPIGGYAVWLRVITTEIDIPACAGCGRCCHLVVELQAHDAVPAELTAVRNGALCMDQRGDGACVALDPVTLLCSIYETRPQTCRDFKRGEALCLQILGHPRKLG